MTAARSLIGPLPVLLAASGLLGPAALDAQTLARELLDTPSYPVAYHDTMLANGLRVLVVEQRFAPVVAAELMVRAGSRNDPEGRGGLAHLLEHSTAKIGIADELWRGVGFGASTGPEWTDYFFTAHTVYLDAGLYLLAANLRSETIDLEGLETERGVVIAEGGQRVANRPYGRSSSCLEELFARGGSTCSLPERWRTETLATTAEDLLAFHRDHYHPSNAVLAIVGDVVVDDVVARVDRWFGDLPPGEPGSQHAVPKEGGPPRTLVLEDPLARRPRLDLAYAIPAAGLRETAALNVLIAVLGRGEASRLHRRLVAERRVLEQVEVAGFDFRLSRVPGPLEVTAYLGRGLAALPARQALEEELRRLAEDPPTAAELARAKAVLAREFLEDTRNDGVRGLAFNLVYFTAVHDAPERINAWLEAVDAVSAEDVAELARVVFGDGARVVVETIPPSGDSP